MKLYATTTSERASKGQGGNKYLRMDLTMLDEKKQVVKFCTLYYGEEDGEYSLGIDRGNGEAETIHTKGKQKKGDCEHESTLMTHDGVECADCHEQI